MRTFENKHPETAELTTSINDTLICLSKLDDSEKLSYYPLAFLGIFVKFQKLVYNQFELYCLGERSSCNYCPIRKHVFHSEQELRAFLKIHSEYIDYDERILDLSEYIFENNPFTKMFSIQPQGYHMLKHIRNHIAHESQSSFTKLYNARILKEGQNINQYFAMRSKRSKIHFHELVNSLYEFSNYIIEGDPDSSTNELLTDFI